MFTLTIKTNNAAFSNDDGTEDPEALSAEVARILRELAERIECGGTGGGVVDVNGNKVGKFELTDE